MNFSKTRPCATTNYSLLSSRFLIPQISITGHTYIAPTVVARLFVEGVRAQRNG